MNMSAGCLTSQISFLFKKSFCVSCVFTGICLCICMYTCILFVFSGVCSNMFLYYWNIFVYFWEYIFVSVRTCCLFVKYVYFQEHVSR